MAEQEAAKPMQKMLPQLPPHMRPDFQHVSTAMPALRFYDGELQQVWITQSHDRFGNEAAKTYEWRAVPKVASPPSQDAPKGEGNDPKAE